MNTETRLERADATVILAHGKSWFVGDCPVLLYIEDEAEARTNFEKRLGRAFEGLAMRSARSVQGSKNLFSADQTRYDFIVLDHRIFFSEDDGRAASEEELSEFLEYVLRIGETRCGFLIRVTAYVDEANKALKEIEGRVPSNALLRFCCLIVKTTGWDELALAYIYRNLALSNYQRLEDMFQSFDFDRLNGTKPLARPRQGQLRGAEEFGAFQDELTRWWPFLSHWPSDSLRTSELLQPLVARTWHYFDVDESEIDWEAGEGQVHLTLKFQPGPYRPISAKGAI